MDLAACAGMPIEVLFPAIGQTAAGESLEGLEDHDRSHHVGRDRWSTGTRSAYDQWPNV
jgi:hypothetical protein